MTIKESSIMSRKPETIFTSRKLNKASHDERKAARRAVRRMSDFERFASEASHEDMCYVNLNGMALPTFIH